MAVQLKISTEERENSFVVYDCTGEWSGDNKGGYGGLNPKITDITKAISEIEPPKSSKPYPFSIDVTGDIPNKEGIGFEVFPSQVQLQKITSGKWKFKYTVTMTGKGGSNITKTAYLTDVFINDITCCIDALSPALTANPFKSPKEVKILELSNLLENANGLVEAGSYDKADDIIDYMNGQCKCQNC
jgi:hypothetical protein